MSANNVKARRGIPVAEIRKVYKDAELAAMRSGATPAAARVAGLVAVSDRRWSTMAAPRRVHTAELRAGLSVINGGAS